MLYEKELLFILHKRHDSVSASTDYILDRLSHSFQSIHYAKSHYSFTDFRSHCNLRRYKTISKMVQKIKRDFLQRLSFDYLVIFSSRRWIINSSADASAAIRHTLLHTGTANGCRITKGTQNTAKPVNLFI